MDGKEYLHENITKEELIGHICFYCCPSDFGFETEYSLDKNKCRGSYQGDCGECWNSKFIE